MVDKNYSGNKGCSDMCCINVNRIFDSARDKDCLEDLRVFLCGPAQELLDRASNIRCKSVEIVSTNINLETVPFNRGFYQVNIRFYFCCTLEACVFNGTVTELKGIAVCDKKIILFGGEKNVSIFTSDPERNTFCPRMADIDCDAQSTLPIAVVEAASPICLDAKIIERSRPFGNCCCGVESIPENVQGRFESPFVDGHGTNRLFVTIGMFTVIRLERPVQLLLPTCSYCLPDKDSTPAGCSNDPCSVFSKLGFPMNEFFPLTEPTAPEVPNRGGDRPCPNR